ncbi:reverse transcriptase domain-containing protein [Tanacetum coccineum]
MYVDGGSSVEVLFEHCFNRLRPEIHSQMAPATTSLTGFSGETIWPIGQIRLLVNIGDAEHSTEAWMNFMIVRSPSPYNGIIGRPGIKEIQAVPFTTHGMIKFPVKGGVVTIHQEISIGGTLSAKGRTQLCALLKRDLDIFTWQPSDMTRVPRSIAEHKLNIRNGYSPVRQKKRGQAPERAKVIQAEVQKLVEAGIMREVYYHDWLSNPVMVKKHDGSWRMCVDFTNLNKACPQDCYPLPEIDWKIESLCDYPFKCFMDAYKGYHQIQMAEEDEEKTAFHTPRGYIVGCNLEVYVDDLVIKSHTEEELLRYIEETFRTLRKINMKLNPKKCTFGAVEVMFLGYVVGPEGIKPCPNKVDAVLQLPSPQTIKEVQSLNGKLAGLNRFLSKSAEKSLPLFKTLKNCTKKSDLCWTADAEKSFKELKQHLSKLPTLVAPRPQEELIMYLSASHGAVGAVLMTERNTVQTPVYFISRALQGPEVNYTPMEKLVLALVFAAKRLRRYFQAHPIAVITDQPIKQIISRPDVAGRL